MAKTKTAKKSSSKTSIASKAVGLASSLLGGKSGKGGKRRAKGVNYWANKVMVAKLKKKYNKIRYGGM